MKAFKLLLVDLDETLYPKNSGIWQGISTRINLYLEQRLDVSARKAEQLRADYLAHYGTTLNGLLANHQIDPHDYLQFVHHLPIDVLLEPDPQLKAMLASTRVRRAIFTNADQAHARRVLNRLGIADLFDDLIDILALEFVNKPQPEAYQRALALCGQPDPSECILVDDRVENLGPAHALGMTTVLVSEREHHPQATHTISTILELTNAMPALLQG